MGITIFNKIYLKHYFLDVTINTIIPVLKQLLKNYNCDKLCYR